MAQIMTPATVVDYLLEHGLIAHESVVDGDLTITDATRRHRNFKVILRNRPSYFIKQSNNADPQAIATLRREARCYWLAQHDVDYQKLATLLPRCYGFDDQRHILVIELFRGAQNLSEYSLRHGELSVKLAGKLGRALSRYHQTNGSVNRFNEADSVFPRMVPWILSAHQLDPRTMNPQSDGHVQLFQLIQGQAEFHHYLGAVRNQWQPDSLIHGDMKWDNCLIVGGDDQAADPQIKIIDWELADFGDAGWDVGSVIQSFISRQILSMPADSNQSQHPSATLTPRALLAIRPPIQAFWKGYCENLPHQAEWSLLERCVNYGAARMIQTAYEYLSYSPQITPHALGLLQVSLNTLRSPSLLISQLFGTVV